MPTLSGVSVPDNLSRDTDDGWQMLYRVGAWAALIAALIFRRNLAAEVMLFAPQTPPAAATEWFALLLQRPLLGLTFLNLFDGVNTVLLGLLFLALYVALRRAERSLSLLALSLGLVGAAVTLASNQAFSLLALSGRYAAATSDVGRAAFAAAGEALLAANDSGTTAAGPAIHIGLLMVTLAGLLFSLAMLRSRVFGRWAAVLGLLGNGLVLLYFPVLLAAPNLTFIPHSAAAIPLVVWQILSARRLFHLARAERKSRENLPA